MGYKGDIWKRVIYKKGRKRDAYRDGSGDNRALTVVVFKY
jgi:hypothetical protein